MNRDQRLIAAAAVVVATSAVEASSPGTRYTAADGTIRPGCGRAIVDPFDVERLRRALNRAPRPPRIKRDRGEP